MPNMDRLSKISLDAYAATRPPTRRPGASELLSWAGMALPLTACIAIWGIGDADPAGVAWLSVAHGVIGTAASAWTVFQLALRWRAARTSRRDAAFLPKPSLIALYVLLGLQPLIAVAASMLHGGKATLFGITLPSILPMNHNFAAQADRLHGAVAVLLLMLIALQVERAMRILRRRERKPA